MIWSIEIDYSGWEDDIHHVHFFIEQNDRPTEEQVVEHYNQVYYEPDKYSCYGWMQKDSGGEWEMLDWYGDHEYAPYITIGQLKTEELKPLSRKPTFAEPLPKFQSLIDIDCPIAATMFGDNNLDTALDKLKFGETLSVKIPPDSFRKKEP